MGRKIGIGLLVAGLGMVAFDAFRREGGRAQAAEDSPALSPSLSDELEEYNVREAKQEADGFCRAMTTRCLHKFRIYVHSSSWGGWPERTLGYTTVVRGRDTGVADPSDHCVLHVNRTTVQMPGVIAHELCHCQYDWSVIDDVGFVASVGVEEKARRESMAKRCEKELTQ